MLIPELKFNAKEQRYFDYISDEGNSRNIGDICRALHTTAWTLLRKTKPEVERKCAEFHKQYVKICAEHGIEP